MNLCAGSPLLPQNGADPVFRYLSLRKPPAATSPGSTALFAWPVAGPPGPAFETSAPDSVSICLRPKKSSRLNEEWLVFTVLINDSCPSFLALRFSPRSLRALSRPLPRQLPRAPIYGSNRRWRSSKREPPRALPSRVTDTCAPVLDSPISRPPLRLSSGRLQLSRPAEGTQFLPARARPHLYCGWAKAVAKNPSPFLNRET